MKCWQQGERTWRKDLTDSGEALFIEHQRCSGMCMHRRADLVLGVRVRRGGEESFRHVTGGAIRLCSRVSTPRIMVLASTRFSILRKELQAAPTPRSVEATPRYLCVSSTRVPFIKHLAAESEEIMQAEAQYFQEDTTLLYQLQIPLEMMRLDF